MDNIACLVCSALNAATAASLISALETGRRRTLEDTSIAKLTSAVALGVVTRQNLQRTP
jgi:hypothetical protein